MATGNLSLHIPEEVLVTIFLNLPARSLVLFRSVCKHWLALIQNTNFIHLHLNHHDHQPLLILPSFETKSHYRTTKSKSRSSKKVKPVLTLMSDDDATLPFKEEFPLEALSPSMARRGVWLYEDNLHISGPCNGLFCVTDEVDIVVFNPVTRQCRELPPSPMISPSRDRDGDLLNHFDSVLFGFDSFSNDYKVVGFSKIEEKFEDDEFYDDISSDGGSDPYYHTRHRVEIFSLGTNSWSQADLVIRRTNVPSSFRYNLFFNGAFHWFGYSNFHDMRTVFTFDLNIEVFSKFELPNNFIELDPRKYHPKYLSVLDEYLTVVVHKVTNQRRRFDEFIIWVMKDYGVENSWTKLYSINTYMRIQKPMSFYKDGEFLLEDRDGQLVSFNLNTRVFKKLEVPANPMFAFRYRESLVSPGGSRKGKFERKKRKKSRF